MPPAIMKSAVSASRCAGTAARSAKTRSTFWPVPRLPRYGARLSASVEGGAPKGGAPGRRRVEQDLPVRRTSAPAPRARAPTWGRPAAISNRAAGPRRCPLPPLNRSHLEKLGVARLDFLALRQYRSGIRLEQFQARQRRMAGLFLDLGMERAMREIIHQQLLSLRAEKETLEQPRRIWIRCAAEHA